MYRGGLDHLGTVGGSAGAKVSRLGSGNQVSTAGKAGKNDSWVDERISDPGSEARGTLPGPGDHFFGGRVRQAESGAGSSGRE